ncbi:MAG: hypothetical protein JXB03_03690 [Spirochaetales bacterium]|nr:hypothetical protein [Spirochaetales bacterium]
MTIRTRNWIFIFGILYVAFLFVLTLVFIVRYDDSLPSALHASPSTGNTIFFLVQASLVAACSHIILLCIFIYFRRTASAEVFFLFIFIMSYPQEAVLSCIHHLSIIHIPVYFLTIGYRFYFFLQFMGVFSLFSAGLFPNSFQYSKLEIFAGVVALAAFTLAAFVPIDTTFGTTRLLYFKEVFLLLIGIKILSVVNMLFAAYRQNSRQYSLIGLSTLMLIIAREIHSNLSGPTWLTVGIVLYITGSFIYLKSLHTVYQWI